ncbi:phage tail protein [Enterobacteriaceae bacterium RIT711]|nr:phage tail protein [Enterobacteriaceae bacterium RIT711]
MKYFKNIKNEIYAFEDDADDEYILPGLVSITEEEATTLLNPPLTKKQLIALAEDKKLQLRAAADAEISWRQDALDAGIATDEETSELEEWRKYRVLLMRVDTSNPEWPELPKLG